MMLNVSDEILSRNVTAQTICKKEENEIIFKM